MRYEMDNQSDCDIIIDKSHKYYTTEVIETTEYNIYTYKNIDGVTQSYDVLYKP